MTLHVTTKYSVNDVVVVDCGSSISIGKIYTIRMVVTANGDVTYQYEVRLHPNHASRLVPEDKIIDTYAHEARDNFDRLWKEWAES